MKNNKKGFTIVELVIVIAVIAILASVLVPTFKDIIIKAQRNADTQVVRMLNEDVAIDIATTGKTKHDTMYEAIQACIKQGLSPEKITSKSDYKIAWESTTGKFVLIDLLFSKVMYPQNELENVEYDILGKEIDYFIITTYDNRVEEDPNFLYSVYAYGNDWPSEIKVHAGFDTGDVTSIKKITYSNESSNVQNVIIATNNFDTKVYIDGTNSSAFDTVSHYGYTCLASINGGGNNLYYEYGVTGRIALTNGTVTMASNNSTCYCAMKLDSNASFNTSLGYISSIPTNSKSVDSSITPIKDDYAVSNTLIADCGFGNHDKHEIVYDGNHVYYVCPCCGYILVNTYKIDDNANFIYHTNLDTTKNVDDSLIYTNNVYIDTFINSINLLSNHMHNKEYQSLSLGKHLVSCKDCSSQYEEEHTFDENGKCIYCDYVINLKNSKWKINRYELLNLSPNIFPYSVGISLYYNAESCDYFIDRRDNIENIEYYINRYSTFNIDFTFTSYLDFYYGWSFPDISGTSWTYFDFTTEKYEVDAFYTSYIIWNKKKMPSRQIEIVYLDYFTIEFFEFNPNSLDLSKYDNIRDDLTIYKILQSCGEIINE